MVERRLSSGSGYGKLQGWVVAVFSSASPVLLRVHVPTRTDPVWVFGPVPLPASRSRPVSRSINNLTSSRLHKPARFLQSRDTSTRLIITRRASLLTSLLAKWKYLSRFNMILSCTSALTLFLIIKSLLLMKSYTWNKFHFLNSCNKYPRNRDDDKSYLIIKIIFILWKIAKFLIYFWIYFQNIFLIIISKFSSSKPDGFSKTRWWIDTKNHMVNQLIKPLLTALAECFLKENW